MTGGEIPLVSGKPRLLKSTKMFHWPAFFLAFSLIVLTTGNSFSQQTSTHLAFNNALSQTNSFLNCNGVMWYYNTFNGNKFSDIQNDLSELQNNGLNILGFYCVFHGDKYMFHGCDPLDWFNVSPQCGTLQDFKDLTAAAHKRGMKVISYFTNIYIDNKSSLFKKAEIQYKAGNLTAKECAAFRWQNDSTGAYPSPDFGFNKWDSWAKSATAGAYYWSIWSGYGLDKANAHPAAVDFNSPAGVNMAETIGKFWIDAGLDGFAYDCGQLMDAKLQSAFITTPKTYTPGDKWICSESSEGSKAQSYYDFGYTCWFNYKDNDKVNDYGRVISGEINADGLETALANSDWAHSKNCWTYAWSIWTDPPMNGSRIYPKYKNDEVMRIQEAALLAGAGITYGCGVYDQYLTWPQTLKTNWGKVLKTVSANPSLFPSASRTRVSTGDLSTYAMKRTSRDGAQTALLIYNFNDSPKEVSVNLSGSGINTNQTPKDLCSGGKGPAITTATYTVYLPAYGFMILGVSK